MGRGSLKDPLAHPAFRGHSLGHFEGDFGPKSPKTLVGGCFFLKGCRKRRSVKGVRSLFWVFRTLSVAFWSLFLMLLSLFSSIFCKTPFAGRLSQKSEKSVRNCLRVSKQSSLRIRKLFRDCSRHFLERGAGRGFFEESGPQRVRSQPNTMLQNSFNFCMCRQNQASTILLPSGCRLMELCLELQDLTRT